MADFVEWSMSCDIGYGIVNSIKNEMMRTDVVLRKDKQCQYCKSDLYFSEEYKFYYCSECEEIFE
jgi:ribosomal protein L37AE/L43A